MGILGRNKLLSIASFQKKYQDNIKCCGKNGYCLCLTSQREKSFLWNIDRKLSWITTTTNWRVFPLINTKTFIDFESLWK